MTTGRVSEDRDRVIFDIETDPAPQGSMRAMLIGGQARLVPGGSNKAHARLKQFRADIVDGLGELLPDDWVPWGGPVQLAVTFWMPRPKAAKGRRWCIAQPSGDLDKLLRALCDGLGGAKSAERRLFRDDSQVAVISRCSKRYVSEEHPVPGVTVIAEVLAS